MAKYDFSAELAKYGPEGAASRPFTARQGRRYCRRLARRHYENFTVVSFLLPAHLRQHFYNIYAYCRWADDLADETESPAEGLRLLRWWGRQLDLCYAGQADHPVFVALARNSRLHYDNLARARTPCESFWPTRGASARGSTWRLRAWKPR
jgi:hypothetical protein